MGRCGYTTTNGVVVDLFFHLTLCSLFNTRHGSGHEEFELVHSLSGPPEQRWLYTRGRSLKDQVIETLPLILTGKDCVRANARNSEDSIGR